MLYFYFLYENKIRNDCNGMMVTDWPFKSGAMTAAYVFNDFQREIMERNPKRKERGALLHMQASNRSSDVNNHRFSLFLNFIAQISAIAQTQLFIFDKIRISYKYICHLNFLFTLKLLIRTKTNVL